MRVYKRDEACGFRFTNAPWGAFSNFAPLAAPIVEVSTRDDWWGAKPAGDSYRGANVLGRLWMELRQQLRDGDPGARAAAWTGRIDVGRLAGAP